MQLIIGNYNYSTWSMRAWLLVHRFDLPVSVMCRNLFTEDMKAVLEGRFSNGKVPLLLDGNFEVWDSLAILEYLGERFPEIRPWPDDAAARAVARSVSAEMHSSFSAIRSEAPMNLRRRFPGYRLGPEALDDVARIQSVWRYCRQRFGTQGPWLFGDFSIADAMFAPVVMRFRSVEVALDETATSYCETVNGDSSVMEWIRRAWTESHVVAEDEIDWPSEPATGT
jgi:glutathione S-transferase